MKHPIILYIICLCVCVACGDDEKLLCKETELIEAPQEFLSYWYFPKGSYWIYKLKDTTGVYDTMRVVSDYKRYCNRGQSNDPDCDQAACTWMYSNTWEHSNDAFFRGGSGSESGRHELTSTYNNIWIASCNNSRYLSVYSPPYPFIYPFTIGEKYMGNNEIVSEDSVQTPAGIFANTLHMIPDKFQLDSNINQYVEHLYLTPNVGVVKWHYTRNHVWELIEYDVTP